MLAGNVRRLCDGLEFNVLSAWNRQPKIEKKVD
jgi:hypothetical protein